MQRLILAFLAFFGGVSLMSAQSIDFLPMLPPEAMQRSAIEQKPVMFMAYQKTCGHCEKMLEEVFVDTAVSNFYNAHFLNIKIDMLDQEMAKLYIPKYSISSFPTFIILNDKGDVLAQYVGEFKAEEFINQGKLALDPEKQLPYLRAQFEKNRADSVATYEYLLGLARGRLSTQNVANQYFAANGNTLETNAYNWKILSMSVSDMTSPVFQFMRAHKDDFAAASSIKKVERKFYLTAAYNLQTSISQNDTTRYNIQRNNAKLLNLHTVDSLIFVSDLNIYEKNKMWPQYVASAKNGAEKYVWYDVNLLRRIAENICANSDDPSALQKGANCAVRSAELKPDYFNNLAAARIYEKLGYIDLAKKYGQRAVDEGVKKNMNVTEAARIAAL